MRGWPAPRARAFKIEWNHAYSGSLASFKEVFEAAEEGIAGAALILKNFEPSNLPLEAYPVHLPFVKMTRRQLLNIDRKLRKQIPEMNAGLYPALTRCIWKAARTIPCSLSPNFRSPSSKI